MTPSFDSNGLLPEGIHEMTKEEIKSLLIDNSNVVPAFDYERRHMLFDNYLLLVATLLKFGLTEHLLDGSFVTSKSSPKDIDALFYAGKIEDWMKNILPDLKRIDPVWGLRPKDAGGMQEIYGVEMFPLFTNFPNRGFGKDLYSREDLDPLSFFQRSRIFDQEKKRFLHKGIIKLRIEGGKII